MQAACGEWRYGDEDLCVQSSFSSLKSSIIHPLTLNRVSCLLFSRESFFFGQFSPEFAVKLLFNPSASNPMALPC
jgi:hypothetical protein